MLNILFYLFIIIMIGTHILAIFYEGSESMWLIHNILMVVLGIGVIGIKIMDKD